MRAGIVVNVSRADRRRLEAIVADRSSPQKHVWRAQIVLATADGCGTFYSTPRCPDAGKRISPGGGGKMKSEHQPHATPQTSDVTIFRASRINDLSQRAAEEGFHFLIDLLAQPA
jgi:hypothetical protein